MFLTKRLAKLLFSSAIGIVSVSTPLVFGSVVFEENFNNQPDWTSDPAQTLPLPENWHALTQYGVQWAPSAGYPDMHEGIEILASNASKARGGTGKSMVNWRDGYRDGNGDQQWMSDSLLWFRLPGDGFSEIYAEYHITFSSKIIEAFYANQMGMSKVFRVIAHDDPDNRSWQHYDRFFGEYNKPIYIWGLDGTTQYGVRNKTSIYRWGGTSGSSDPAINATLNSGPWNFLNGDWSGSYAESVTAGQAVGGGDPGLTDYKNSGTITGSHIAVDRVFGDEATYVKMGHYVKMNSAPGVPDGELHQFIDDKRVSKITGINWTVSESPMKKWNIVALGGNDYFSRFPTKTPHEDWYSIDDLVIRSDLPEHLKTDNYVSLKSPPRPPSTIDVQ